MVDFYIFRHGETDINKQKRWQGSGTDVDLNETGRAQAACLFDKLKDKKLEIIYSSPLIRAYHTAQIAAKPLGIEVVKFPDLRECHYGVAEGMTFDVLGSRGLGDVYKRQGEGYRCVGLAVHGGTMSNLLGYFGVEKPKVPNCGCIHAVYDNGEFRLAGNVF